MLWRALYDAGVYVNVAIYPAVQRGGALLRTSVMATHEREHLDRALEAFEQVQKDVPEPPAGAPPIGAPEPLGVRRARRAAARGAPVGARRKRLWCGTIARGALEPAELVGAGAGHQLVEGAGSCPRLPADRRREPGEPAGHAVARCGPLLSRPGAHQLHDVGGQVERVRHRPAVRAAHGHAQLAVHVREQRVAAGATPPSSSARSRMAGASASVELRMVIAPVISYLLDRFLDLCNRHIHLIGNAITGYHG